MGLSETEEQSRMGISILTLTLGLTLWVVTGAPNFHLKIDVLPESTQSDLQGKFWWPSHHTLILNLGGGDVPPFTGPGSPEKSRRFLC